MKSGCSRPRRTVTIKNEDTGVETVLVTNAAGAYTSGPPGPGRYSVTVDLTGFKKMVSSGILLQGGGAIRHDVALQVGDLAEHGNGTEAVVSTSAPYGFALGDEAADFELTASDRFEPGADEALLCADSFSEFVYRFWIENEIWFALNERRGLTPEQERYVGHYVRG